MDIPKELLKPYKNLAPITCLQCRHCELEPDTNFASALPMIRCHKTEVRRPAALSGCPTANPMPAKPKALHKYWVGRGPIGDKVRHATVPLLAYLRANWTRLPAVTLQRQAGRSMRTLAEIVRTHGIGGAMTRANRLNRCGRNVTAMRFAQSDWLMREHNSERWPKPAITRCFPDELKRRLNEQQRIVGHVATLGPAKTWKQIQLHIEKQKSKANRTAKHIKNGDRRRINQSVEIP